METEITYLRETRTPYFKITYLRDKDCCCCCSVAKSLLTLCDPVDCSTPGLPVPHHLPEFSQVHDHCIPVISYPDPPSSFCPQCFPSSGTFPVSHLFKSDDQNSGASASVLPVNIQSWSPLRLTGLISLLSKGHLGL